jgi:glycine/D-amino acid oxidase-like deaminating enzyme
VAVLGGGIMGCATALFLTRRGARVTLFDAAAAPFSGASRWNEGKIHLGYLYAGDATLATARRVLAGGLSFARLTEELIGTSIAPVVAEQDEIYAVHRESVTSVAGAAAYYEAVAALVKGHPGAAHYLAPASIGPRRLSAQELARTFVTEDIAAAFRVAERSVATPWLADRFVAAVAADPAIELRMDTRVTGVSPADTAGGRWRIRTAAGNDGPFDAVVNALWEGRLAVDATLGLPAPATWSHRCRLSAFVRTSRDVSVPSVVVGTGPFGDVKRYSPRDVYVSWYSAGLVAEGHDVAPPPRPVIPAAEQERIIAGIFDRLGALVPAVRTVREAMAAVRLEGGWVYAAGEGSLADPAATLHRRDRLGIYQSGSYISVDTGKYSVAPWLARQVADRIRPGAASA